MKLSARFLKSVKHLIITGVMAFSSLLSVFGVASIPTARAEGNGKFEQSKSSGEMVRPALTPFKDEDVKKLTIPKSFSVNVFAKGLGMARVMLLDGDKIYISRPESGDIQVLVDKNNDGISEQRTTLVSGIDKVNGMALSGRTLFFVATKKIYTLDLAKKDAKPKLLVDGLPDAGQHQNRVIAIGPDKMLYVSIASTCNDCVDANSDNATLIRMKLDGGGRKTIATGLRDTMGFDWQPGTNDLYGMDHGADWRGNDLPPEELNLIKEGGNYGWPFCWNEKKVDTRVSHDPKGTSKEEFCKTTEGSVLTFTAHSAPIAFRFYTGKQFPAEYQSSAFVTMHGSWNRNPPSGYKVERVIFENGKPTRHEDFLSGFLAHDGRSQFGRPAGLLELKDGSLLVSDDDNGVIYRVSYKPAL